uniref:Uncharacterized protein n=1 Tax=Anopheles funestus TaxID=62324 RepID=A0A182S2L3_ANOFN
MAWPVVVKDLMMMMRCDLGGLLEIILNIWCCIFQKAAIQLLSEQRIDHGGGGGEKSNIAGLCLL